MPISGAIKGNMHTGATYYKVHWNRVNKILLISFFYEKRELLDYGGKLFSQKQSSLKLHKRNQRRIIEEKYEKSSIFYIQ